MNKVKDDFFLHSNKVGHISKEDYDKIELLVNAAKAFARSTYHLTSSLKKHVFYN